MTAVLEPPTVAEPDVEPIDIADFLKEFAAPPPDAETMRDLFFNSPRREPEPPQFEVKVQIRVTEKHIKNGMRRNGHMCAIALAIREHFDTEQVGVSTREALVRKDNWQVNYQLPPEAGRFIGAFDSQMPVGPITFTMTTSGPLPDRRRLPHYDEFKPNPSMVITPTEYDELKMLSYSAFVNTPTDWSKLVSVVGV